MFGSAHCASDFDAVQRETACTCPHRETESNEIFGSGDGDSSVVAASCHVTSPSVASPIFLNETFCDDQQASDTSAPDPRRQIFNINADKVKIINCSSNCDNRSCNAANDDGASEYSVNVISQ